MFRVRAAVTGFDGGPGLMTWYFTTGTYSVERATSIVGHVRGRSSADLGGILPTGVVLEFQTDVAVIDPATGELTDVVTIADPGVVTGTGGASHAPPVIAALLRLSTGTFLGGRRLKGHQFISPLVNGMVEADGTPSATCLAQVASYGASVLATLDAGDAWVVWHRPVAGAGGTAAQVTAATVPNKFAILRSRRD